MRKAIHPTREWGPALEVNRQGRYAIRQIRTIKEPDSINAGISISTTQNDNSAIDRSTRLWRNFQKTDSLKISLLIKFFQRVN